MVIPPTTLEARVAAMTIHFMVAIIVLFLHLVIPDDNVLCPLSASPVVNTATDLSSFDHAPWMFDSGASHHTTMTIASLQNVFSYDGPNLIHLDNGNSLLIFHIGSCTITTATKSLSLTNVLFVPQKVIIETDSADVADLFSSLQEDIRGNTIASTARQMLNLDWEVKVCKISRVCN
ncbi:hypothetical protein GQ457_03G010340 [Hibiscus cannabinus]